MSGYGSSAHHAVRARRNKRRARSRAQATVAEATVAARVRAVMSFYRYHAACGGPSVSHLYEQVHTLPRAICRSWPTSRPPRPAPGAGPGAGAASRRPDVPILTPDLTDALIATEATWEAKSQSWLGDLRYRLFWSLLAETGLRLGEALSLQHRDWQAGRGSTAAIAIVPRPHPHGLIPKFGYRRIYVSAHLDRLYSDYVWALCDRGADAVIDDWDGAYIFCNAKRDPRFAPLRPESVYAHLRMRKRQLTTLPQRLTPHWFRHTHATALLLAGTPLHVVSRRLRHRDVQTTINTYGHVTDDAELMALANWRTVVNGWDLHDDHQ